MNPSVELAAAGSSITADRLHEETIDTVIAGAGPGGLSVAACLKRAGVPFVLLERAEAVGPAWRNHYERLHLHTVRDHSGLSHFPMDHTKFPTYLSRANVVSYLEDYARSFQLEPRFGQEVRSVRRDGARWVVTTQDARYTCEHVVMATGYNRVPLRPAWEGRETFQGRIIHSREYRAGAVYFGRRVLVVGIGNTGGEIAIDLWENGADVTICVRSPIHVTPRDALGTPAHITGLRLSKLPPAVGDWLFTLTNKWLVGDLSKYGIQQAKGSPREDIEKHGRIPLIDIGTIDLIKQGQIKVVPGIKRFHDRAIEFADGEMYQFDDVVLCTGYRGGLDDFLGDVSDFTDEKGYPSPPSGECRTRPGLYFIGFANPTTGFLRQIGIDAQDVARAIAAARQRLNKS